MLYRRLIIFKRNVMKISASVLLASFVLAACATSTPQLQSQPQSQPQSTDLGGDPNEQPVKPPGITVTAASIAREVLQAVPPESALERFEVLDAQGRIISYVAFTDTAFGGVVFVDKKLFGTVSKQEAKAFYSCRGYATAGQNHWAKDATAWTASLLSVAKPASSVQLDFTGLSTFKSIKGIVENPMINQVKSLVDMGSNPVNILKTLYSTRGDMKERDEFKKTQIALGTITPGADENQVAAIIKPEDVSFVTDGLVMAYPRFSVEYYLNGGVVKAIQQPSFHQLSRNNAALFYEPKTQWALCTPQNWKQALQEPKVAGK